MVACLNPAATLTRVRTPKTPAGRRRFRTPKQSSPKFWGASCPENKTEGLVRRDSGNLVRRAIYLFKKKQKTSHCRGLAQKPSLLLKTGFQVKAPGTQEASAQILSVVQSLAFTASSANSSSTSGRKRARSTSGMSSKAGDRRSQRLGLGVRVCACVCQKCGKSGGLRFGFPLNPTLKRISTPF